MSHIGYFIEFEGIGTCIGTEAFTAAGSWASHTFVTGISRVGKAKYSVDVDKRTASTGVLDVDLVDHTGSNSAGTFTDLFATNKSGSVLYLDALIRYSDSMAGGGVVNAHTNIPGSTAPCTFYIEGESFTCTGQNGVQFTGVTREAWNSRAARHIGATSADGYRPRIYLNPPYWVDRIAKLYRVVDDDVSGAGLVWVGPLLDVRVTGINTWRLQIASVMKFLECSVFTENNQIPMLNDWNLASQAIPGENVDDTAFFFYPAFDIQEVEAGLTTTGAGTTTTTVCSSFNEPDDFYGTEYALHFTSGAASGRGAVITGFDNATHTFTHQKLPAASGNGASFRLVKFNSWPPVDKTGSFFAVMKDSVVGVRCCATVTDWADLASRLGPDSTTHYPAALSNCWLIDPNVPKMRGPGSDHATGGTLIKEIVSNYRRYVSTSDASYVDMQDWPAQNNIFVGSIRPHPLKFFNGVWCSTGTGENYSGSGTNWDAYPRNHGVGLPEDLLDHATLEDLGDVLPKYVLAYVGSRTLKQILVNDICVPMGLYPTIDSQGRLTVKRIAQHDEQATPTISLTESEIIDAPVTETDHLTVRTTIKVQSDYDPVTDNYQSTLRISDPVGSRLFDRHEQQEISIHRWYHGSGVAAWDADFLTALSHSLLRYLRRRSNPRVTVRLTVPFEDDSGSSIGLDLRPGDTCKLTTSNVIPLPTGTRTLTNEWFEIQDVELDFMRSTAKLTLYWLGWYDNRYSKYSFTGIVSGWNGGTNTATVTNQLAQSGEDVTTHVQTTDKLLIHHCAASWKGGAVYGTTEELTVDSVTATTITFTGAPANAPVAETAPGDNDGDIITYCVYGNATSSQKQKAYIADAGDADIPGDEGVDGDEYYGWD